MKDKLPVLPLDYCRRFKAGLLLTILISPILSNSAWASTLTPREINNQAVIELTQKHPANAIKLLTPLVRKDPAYGYARNNLIAAYVMLAQENSKDPFGILSYIWRAMCLDQEEKSTIQNLQFAYKHLGKNVMLPKDHTALAEYCLKHDCLYGAWIEFQESLWLKDDPVVKTKMKDLYNRINSAPPDQNDNWLASLAIAPSPELREKARTNVNTGAIDRASMKYMEDLEGILKSGWHPDMSKEKNQTSEVHFKVKRDGTISDVRLSKPSGDKLYDAYCLEVVLATKKAPPLPKGGRDELEIDFTFNLHFYNDGTNDFAVIRSSERQTKLKSLEQEIISLEKQGPLFRRFIPAKLLAIGKLQAELGNYSDSIATYEHCIEIVQTIPFPWGKLCLAYEGKADAEQLSGNLPEAEKTLQHAIALAETEKLTDTSISELLELYGKVLYKANKVNQAEAIYNRVRAVKKAPT